VCGKGVGNKTTCFSKSVSGKQKRMNSRTLLIFLLILTSCSNVNETNKEVIENPSKDTIVYYDSLKLGYGGYIKFENTLNTTEMLAMESKKDNPLDNTSSKEFLGDLGRNDTLILFSSVEFQVF